MYLAFFFLWLQAIKFLHVISVGKVRKIIIPTSPYKIFNVEVGTANSWYFKPKLFP